MNEQPIVDHFGHIDDLQWALGLPDIKAALSGQRSPSDAEYLQDWQCVPSSVDLAREAGGPYLLVSALGFCRLYGVTLPAEMASVLRDPLPAGIVVRALHGLVHALKQLADHAQQLPEKFDDAEPIEDVALCTSILHQLMQTWAAFIVLNDNYQHYLNVGGSPSGKFGQLMGDVLNAFDEAHEVAQREEQIQLLSIAAELPLLQNWRNALCARFKEILPWWLDGRLEQLAISQPALTSETWKPVWDAFTPLGDLLIRRNDEISAQHAEYSLAADSRSSPLRAEHELTRTAWPVANDPRVCVRFELDNAGARRELKLRLVGPSDVFHKYASAELGFLGGQTRSAPVSLGVAIFDVEPTEIKPSVSISLFDQNGRRADVLLSEDRNGGASSRN